MASLAPAARLVLTLAVGAAGGGLFYLARLPLPWMLGSMVLCLVAILFRAPLQSPRRLRPPLVTVIGVTLGSAFSASAVNEALNWYPVVASILFSSVLMSAIGFVYLYRVAKYDPVTAYFASVPGGLYEMTSQGAALGGNARSISLIQATRVFIVVLTIPLFFRITHHLGTSGGTLGLTAGPADNFYDATILIACAVAGWPLAKLLRFPNPQLIGPLVFSALAHILEVTHSVPPYLLVSAAQVVLGASIGSNFLGASLGDLWRILSHGVVLFFLMIAACVGLSFVVAWLFELDVELVVLALAPAGMTEMCLVALALHANVVFVSVHQLFRIVLIHLCAPAIFKSIKPRRRNGDSAEGPLG